MAQGQGGAAWPRVVPVPPGPLQGLTLSRWQCQSRAEMGQKCHKPPERSSPGQNTVLGLVTNSTAESRRPARPTSTMVLKQRCASSWLGESPCKRWKKKKKNYLNCYLRDKEHKVPLAKGGVCLAFTRGLLFSGLQQWPVTLPELLSSSFRPGNPTFLSRKEATTPVLLKYLSSV